MSGGEHSIANARNHAAEPALVVIAVTLSAGGLAPLRTIVRGLPSNFPAAVVIAQHVYGRTFLPEILASETPLPVVLAGANSPLLPGTVYVCPAQQHVIVNPDATFSLSQRRRVSFFRPSSDWLFDSVAASFRERAFAIVLSGRQNDGARGIWTIREAGGTVIVQDPDTSEHPQMPRAAIDTGFASLVLDADQISTVLNDMLDRINLQQCRLEWDSPFTFGVGTNPLLAV